MLYEELEQRYGKHIAKRVQRELNFSEFKRAEASTLSSFLELRAEMAAQHYKSLMADPLERGNVRSEVLQKQWRDAEELAYLLSIAEDVASTVRASINGVHA